MEGRGNLEFVAPFPVPGSRRSHGRVRHIAHIPKCQFRTPVSEALTMNNFFFAAEARTPSRPVSLPGCRLDSGGTGTWAHTPNCTSGPCRLRNNLASI